MATVTRCLARPVVSGDVPPCTFHRSAVIAYPAPRVDHECSHLGGWRSYRDTASRSLTRVQCQAVAPPNSSAPKGGLEVDCEEVMQRLHNTSELKNCFGQPLTAEEQRSLVRCLDSAQLGVDTCLMDGLEALHQHLMQYCRAVAATQTDDVELVEGAMLLIEQLSLSLGTAAPPEGSQPRFSGQWQTLVATGGGWPYGRVQYVPIIELLEVSEDGRRFRLESKMGPLYTLAVGDVTWQRPPNHLRYHVSDFRVELLGGSLPLPAPAPDHELLVFAAAPGIVLARSCAVGLTLMGKPV